MSEAERRRRLNYKKNRKKWMLIQGVTMLVVAVLIIASALTYYQLDKTYYIDYTESGEVDYKVQLKPNDFYDDEWLPEGQAYVASLINSVLADFRYELNMEAANVNYEYAYSIDAAVEIIDDTTHEALFNPVYEIQSERRATQSSNNKLVISEQVVIDYVQYNELATRFIKTYGLTNAKSNLVVKMNVEVVGSSQEFENNSENEYAVAIRMPLTSRTLGIEMTSSVPSGESKVLACKTAVNRDVFKVVGLSFGGLELLFIMFFIAFVYITRNHDVNYTIKVQKLLSSYRSFIQEITNGFDTRGYQVLTVKTFVEMLGIRDTIQSPILMSENTDQTRTQFFIPTNTKILYLYEIKVENYDELYGANPEWVDDSVVETAPDAKSEAAPKAVERATTKVVETATERVTAEATAKVVENATERVTAEATTKVVEHATSRVTAEATPMVIAEVLKETAPRVADTVIKEATTTVVESVIRETTPRVVETAVREASLAVREQQTAVIEPKIKVIETPVEIDHSSMADLVVAKLIDRLAKAGEDIESAKKTQPVAEPSPTPAPAPVAEPTSTSKPEPVDGEPVEYPTELSEVHVDYEREGEQTEQASAEESAGGSVLETSEPAVEQTAKEALPEEPAAHLADESVEPSVEEIEIAVIHQDNADEIPDGEGDDDESVIVYYDEQGNKLDIKCRRSCMANIIQSDNSTIKRYYSEIKNHILSYKSVKARMSWRYETFKKGRYQLFRLKLRGKTICLYCALDPNEFDTAKYFHEATDAKMFEQVPMLIRVRSDRGLKKAKEIIDITMDKFGLKPDKKAVWVDYVAEHPYERTQALIDRELIKVLIPEGFVAIDPHHIVAASINAADELIPTPVSEISDELSTDSQSEPTSEELLCAAIEEAMATPDVELSEVDYIDEEVEVYDESDGKAGVEVVGVVWNERKHNNIIYNYDPNGEELNDGDVVLVPTKASSREIIRKAAVAHGNHKVDPDTIKHPLKKIISVVRRKIEDVLSGK